MKTLHLYVTRQVFASLLLTVIVFTFVLLLGNLLKELLSLLVNGQASPAMVAQGIALLIPFVLVFALPMGMLTATLLVFGRLSADQELTAVRASGVSLVALSTPVLLLSVAASCVAALVNLQLAPWCRTTYLELIYRAGVQRATAFVETGRFIDDFQGYDIYITNKKGNRLEGLRILETTATGEIKRWVRAEWAEIVSDAVNREATLRLFEVSYYDFEAMQTAHVAEQEGFRLQYRPPGQKRRPGRLSDMTFFELREELRKAERLAAHAPPIPSGTAPEQIREQHRRARKTAADLTAPIRLHMHRQVAFSFACIGFTLVGIPLGVRAHRRETSAGIAMALLLVVVYYAFILLAQSLRDRPDFAPHLIFWLPNFLFQVVGAALLWRANHR